MEMQAGKKAGVDFAKNAGRKGHGSSEDEWKSRGLARYVQRWSSVVVPVAISGSVWLVEVDWCVFVCARERAFVRSCFAVA